MVVEVYPLEGEIDILLLVIKVGETRGGEGEAGTVAEGGSECACWKHGWIIPAGKGG